MKTPSRFSTLLSTGALIAAGHNLLGCGQEPPEPNFIEMSCTNIRMTYSFILSGCHFLAEEEKQNECFYFAKEFRDNHKECFTIFD